MRLSFDVDNITLEALLLQSGYLTIDRVDNVSGRQFYQLGYPNREVKSSLKKLLGVAINKNNKSVMSEAVGDDV